MEDIQNKIVYVVCEGDSEAAFLQEFNKYLQNKEIKLRFIISNVGTGHYNKVKKKYNEVRKKNRHAKFIAIWVDKDIYLRNEQGNFTKYSKKGDIPDFRFTYMNYEDFLTLHYDKKLRKWTEICNSKNHFRKPMHKKEYMPLFTKYIYPNYEKGSLPFDLNPENIKTLFKNNRKAENNPNAIHCEFISFLDDLLAKIPSCQTKEFYEPRT